VVAAAGHDPIRDRGLLDRPKFHDTGAMHGDSGIRPTGLDQTGAEGLGVPAAEPAYTGAVAPGWHHTAEVPISQLRFRNAASSRTYCSSRRPTRTRRARMW
jgi:hypothetical protein